MAEETSPCSRLTPFVLAASRIEKAVMLKLPLSRAEVERLVGLAADVADPGLEVLAHELAVEGLVAGGHRGVRREDRRALHRGERLVQAVAHAHPLARPLEREEGHVALVHVPDRGVDAERAQRAHAADPVDDLLAEPHLAPAHVQRAGDGPVGGVVERDVGVEHEHRDEPHLHRDRFRAVLEGFGALVLEVHPFELVLGREVVFLEQDR